MKKALKDEQENFPHGFLPVWTTTEEKALFKSKFCHELGEMNESILTIVQTMTAYLWSWLSTIKNKIFF